MTRRGLLGLVAGLRFLARFQWAVNAKLIEPASFAAGIDITSASSALMARYSDQLRDILCDDAQKSPWLASLERFHPVGGQDA